MLEAALWGFVAGSALLIGAVVGLWVPVSHRFVGLVMGFGSGVLFSAVAFELTGEAYDSAGIIPVALGLLGGATVFFAGDLWLDRRGGHRRKSPTGPQPDAAASALVLGALLDGIPESAAIGAGLVVGSQVGLAVVAAVFLSNVPEAMSASAGMKAAGHSASSVLRMWAAVVVASALAAAVGFALLGGAGAVGLGFGQAFAAGAILTMLADTMVPEAVHHAGPLVGLVTALGFTSAFVISHV